MNISRSVHILSLLFRDCLVTRPNGKRNQRKNDRCVVFDGVTSVGGLEVVLIREFGEACLNHSEGIDFVGSE